MGHSDEAINEIVDALMKAQEDGDPSSVWHESYLYHKRNNSPKVGDSCPCCKCRKIGQL